MKAIAIGGGGFTHGTFPALDDLCLRHAGGGAARIGFIGTASQDDPQKIARFHHSFAGKAQHLAHLQRSLSAQELAEALMGLDFVYVGGGDTERMLQNWRETGWDRVLVAAYRAGVTLGGVSAGAMCWFAQSLFHSGHGPMRVLNGLGLISMGGCPHYSSEPERRGAVHKAVETGELTMTLALDDGAAVVFEDGSPIEVFSASKSATAYWVTREGTFIKEEPLSARYPSACLKSQF